MFPAMSPERRIRTLVESIMDCEEVTDFVPKPTAKPVRVLTHDGAIPQAALPKGQGKHAAFIRDAEERSRLEGFDESGGITYREDISDPLTGIAPGDERHDTRRADLGILPPELRLRLGIGDEL